MYQNDINVDHVMREYGISATAARALFHINRFIYASRRAGKKDAHGVAFSFASRNAIAKAIGKSVRTVSRATAELKAAGLILIVYTRHNAHIYLTAYSVDGGPYGTSESATNGTSNNNSKSLNNSSGKSINLHKTEPAAESAAPVMTACAVDDSKIAVTPARIVSEIPQNVNNGTGETAKNAGDGKKGKPTPKRRQRITKAEKEAAKAKYKAHLVQKLGLNDLLYTFTPGLDEEWSRLDAMADVIADAMSVKNRLIKVNDCYLTQSQYWAVVQNIENNSNLAAMFERIAAAEIIGGIGNKRAYILASVYNACQWESCIKGAEPSKDALYRAMSV